MDLEILLGVLKPLIEALGGKFGIILQIVGWIGMLRILIKPLQGFILAIVQVIPGTKDDEAVNGFFASKGWKMFIYALDWFASVKTKK
jgi:hypothetical protein